MRKTDAASRGFTLLELSMSLMAIGLIVTAIMTGRTLLRQSEINSLLIDKEQYLSAAHQFIDKYNYPPGDMPTATTYWGIAGGSSLDNYTTSCSTIAGSGTQTCNGNGDGLISGASFGGYESFEAWQQMADAGFIKGNFPPTGTGAVWTNVPGKDNPVSKPFSSQFLIGWRGNYASAANGIFIGNYRHTIEVYGAAGGGVITASEARAFDAKSDDGAPGTGAILGGYSNSCTTTSVSSSALYNTSQAGLSCFLYFPLDF